MYVKYQRETCEKSAKISVRVVKSEIEIRENFFKHKEIGNPRNYHATR